MSDILDIELSGFHIHVLDEPLYSFQSTDNQRRYAVEIALGEETHYTSRHGVVLNGEPFAVLLAPGGCTRVHEHSAILLEKSLYLAVGDHVACLGLPDRRLVWALKVDPSACFGIFYEANRNALISHGELDIVRFNRDGRMLWRSSGADIFSQGFRLMPDYVEAVDFDGRTYRFDYETGKEIAA